MKFTSSFFRAATICLLPLVAMLHAQPAHATRESRSLPTDHRVRSVMYQADEVYKFTGHYRYQTSIEFGKDEEIKTISMGDSTAWMVNPSGYRLFLKPIEQEATTNMTLITNKHTYLFELHAAETDNIDDPNMVFIMRFLYPDSGDAQTLSRYLDGVPEPDVVNEPAKYNMNYTISGNDEIAPLRIFDDGEFTFFQFRDKNAEVPAFFWVDEQGNDNILNYRSRGDYIVVERVVNRFTLRHGSNIVCVFNEARIASKRATPMPVAKPQQSSPVQSTSGQPVLQASPR